MTISKFVGKYHCFSNFSPHEVGFEGLVYPTSEHAFQASKSLNFDLRKVIKEIPHPAEAKKMGRTGLILRPNWENLKLGIMSTIVEDKFRRNSVARTTLLSTGTELLVESNTWHDNYWGICSCVSCLVKAERGNWLGKILMDVRAKINSNP
jgi:ribA/ribD-fused uncharacterized protein